MWLFLNLTETSASSSPEHTAVLGPWGSLDQKSEISELGDNIITVKFVNDKDTVNLKIVQKTIKTVLTSDNRFSRI